MVSATMRVALFSILASHALAARIRVGSDKAAHKKNAIVAHEKEASPPTSAVDWLLNDMVQIDAAAAEEKLRKTTNILMPEDQEHVVMAFKCGKDKTYFTTNRILLRPKGWLLSSSTKYESITYKSISAYGMQTAGMFPDMDSDLWFWTKMPALPYFALEFRKGGDHADVFKIMEFLNSQLLGTDTGSSLIQTDATNPFVDVWHWLNDNAAEVNAQKVERLFKNNFPVLQQDETVLKAFMSGRDRTLLTSKRLLRVDVTGISGKAVTYESYPWGAIQAFSVKSAGMLDSNCEMSIWTNIPDTKKRKFEQNLRSFGPGTPDVEEIQNIFANHILGTDPSPPVLVLPSKNMPVASFEGGTASEILGWLGGDHKEMHPEMAEARLRAAAPVVLQKDEHVEKAFQKSRFERDMVYLTTKRLLVADIDKLLHYDDKVEYFSVPFRAIHAWEAETAAVLDFDSKFSIYTGISPPPPIPHCVEVASDGTEDNMTETDRHNTQDDTQNDGANSFVQEPIQNDRTEPFEKTDADGKKQKCSYISVPGQSKIDVELRASTDLAEVQKLFFARVSNVVPEAPLHGLTASTAEHPSIFNPVGLYHWLDGNAKEIDPQIAERQLIESGPILADGEIIHKAFTTWRDLTLLTSHRVLIADVQAVWPARKIVYTSIPYNSIHAFGVKTGGTFDFDAEILLYTTMPWLPVIQQDLRRGTSNIAEIQSFLCAKIVGSSPSGLLQTGSGNQGPAGNFLDWLGSNAGKIDAEEAAKQLQTQPPLLQDGETLKLAYKVGHDLTVFTSHRILYVNVADFDLFSKKVEYRSIPYSSILGFTVETAANYFDRDEEITVNTDMHKLATFNQDIAAGNKDIFDVQKLLSNRVL